MNKVGLGRIVEVQKDGTQVVMFLTNSGSSAIPKGSNIFLRGVERCAGGRFQSKVILEYRKGSDYGLWFARLASPNEWKRLTKGHKLE